MTCPNCGRTLPDGMQCSCMSAAQYSSNPAVNVLKREGASVRFLVLAILLSVSAVLSIFASSTTSNYFWDELYYNTYMDWDVYNALSSVMNNVFAAIPTILMAVGLWMFYASCRNVSHGGVSTSGLTIIKVLMIIAMVLLCFVGFIVLIAGFVMALNPSFFYDYGSYYNSYYNFGTGIIIFAVFIIAAVLALMIVYLTRIIKIINRVKRVAKTGMPNNEISMFAVVIFYIMAGFNVISAFSSLGDMYISPLGILSYLAGAATFVVGAIVLMRYKKEMTILMYSNPPTYQGFAQQPVQGAYAPPVQQNVVYPNADINQPYGQQAGYVPPQVNNWQSAPVQPYAANQQPAEAAAPPVQDSAQQAAEAAMRDVEEAKAVFSSEQLPSFDEIQKGMGGTESVSEVRHSGEVTEVQPVSEAAPATDSIRHAVEEQAESASVAAEREVEKILNSADPFAPLSTAMTRDADPVENEIETEKTSEE